MNERTLAAITKYFPTAVIMALCLFILKQEGKYDELQKKYDSFRDMVYSNTQADNHVLQELLQRRDNPSIIYIPDTVRYKNGAK